MKNPCPEFGKRIVDKRLFVSRPSRLISINSKLSIRKVKGIFIWFFPEFISVVILCVYIIDTHLPCIVQGEKLTCHRDCESARIFSAYSSAVLQLL